MFASRMSSCTVVGIGSPGWAGRRSSIRSWQAWRVAVKRRKAKAGSPSSTFGSSRIVVLRNASWVASAASACEPVMR